MRTIDLRLGLLMKVGGQVRQIIGLALIHGLVHVELEDWGAKIVYPQHALVDAKSRESARLDGWIV